MANGFRTPRSFPRGETVNIDTGSLEQDLYKVSLATDIIDARAFGGTEDINIGPTKEQMITAAIQYAAAVGASRVLVPKSMSGWNPALVTFNSAVQLVGEGFVVNTTVVDVTNFGAVSSASIDSTSAFTKAMNALSALGGGIFYIPKGNFIADPPAIVANVTIQGAGKNVSNITAATINGVWTAVDVSNVTLRDFTFIGKSANGVNTTNRAVFISAATVDVTDVLIERCAFKQCKAIDAMVRIAGNGDLVTPATKFVKRVKVLDCTISEYYDTNPALLAVAAYGIYFFGGVQEIWAQRNYIDGTNGKHGLIAQSEANDVHFEDNTVVNCGSANAQFGYGITVYSSYSTVSVVDATIHRNIVKNSAKAGIYVSYAGKFVVSDNTLDTCDVFSAGIGTVGTGAIMINNSADLASNGVGTVVGNTIIDPGFCGIYLNIGSFGRSDCVCTDNMLKLTTAVDRTGIVLWGRGAVISGNIIRGYRRGIFLYTTADNIIGDATINDNEIDGTGAFGSPVGITYNTLFTINPLIVSGNRIKACVVGLQIDQVTDLDLSDNIFTGCTTGAIVTVTRGVVKGNIGDTGTTGLNVKLIAATATARATVQGNLMGGFTTPCTITENTGQIILGGNDFGTQPGISADVGDASLATGLNQPAFEVFRWSTTLTVNRTATQGAAKCFRGDKRRILRDAAVPGAFTLAVIDNLGATLYTMAANTKGFADLVFDGTNWKLSAAASFV